MLINTKLICAVIYLLCNYMFQKVSVLQLAKLGMRVTQIFLLFFP